MRVRAWVPGGLAALLVTAMACGSGGVGDSGGRPDAPHPDIVAPSDVPTPDDVRPEVREILVLDYGLADPDPGEDPGDEPEVPADVSDSLDAETNATDAPLRDQAIPEVDVPDLPGEIDAVEASDPGTDAFDDRFGDPCVEDADCPSGWCLQTDSGKVCSRLCLDIACPDGWSCRPVQGADRAPTFLCVPGTLNLCRPCNTVFDCRTGEFPMPGLRCVTLGEWEGAFCLPACASASECPAGTTCSMPPAADGKVCLPDGGACSCSAFAGETGASTACARTSGSATCSGIRSCSAEGLSACDAPLPATETCGGGDDDCDGATDEENAQGCSPFYRDVDRDGFGIEGDSKCLCAPSGPYQGLKIGDCDDRNPATHPEATERCNGRDDDCDERTDEEGAEGCAMRYPNADGDGFGGDAGARCLCAPTADLSAASGGDCDDIDATVYPGAVERCNGKDDDCNGTTDENGAVGCQTFYEDADTDGYGIEASSQCKCEGGAPFSATRIGDCNDRDATVFPGATEVCNGKDDNCDSGGVVDEEGARDCEARYFDLDRDGFGLDGTGRCLCRDAASWAARAAGDCNDGDPSVHPFAAEACNGTDDNCDGATDDGAATGCVSWYVDSDADGYGAPPTALCLCRASGTHRVNRGGDCDDTDPFINPEALDLCDNEVDDNCDGTTDGSGCSGCTTYFKDADGDGHGVTGDSACLETPDLAGNYTAPVGDDCDDGAPTVHPGADESCNGVDDDCDGLKDDEGSIGCSVYFLDGDGDRFGLAGLSRCLCQSYGSFTATVGGDCDDTDRQVYPGRIESCNGKDDDCEGGLDEEGSVGCEDWYKDSDGDSHGDTLSRKCLCGPAGQWTDQDAGDCDDSDATIRPGATERCNRRDDNCNGAIDEMGAAGCVPWYLDGDGDGYGLNGQSKCLCAADGMYRAPFANDCDDGNPERNPGAMEVCRNLIDDDCDGSTDEELCLGCLYYFRDMDGDDYGVASDSRCLGGPDGVYRALEAEDCDDAASTVNPGAPERCGNAIDDDCNGRTDDEGAVGCASWYLDRDSDAFGVTGTGRCLCAALGEYRALAADDCNDADPTIHPDAEETCNGRDDDCDGASDGPGATGCYKFYTDQDRDGFGIKSTEQCLCSPQPPLDARLPGDCDDAAVTTFPGAIEMCNGRDDDCDGVTDGGAAQGCVFYFRDYDGDTFGDPADSRCLCAPTAEFKVTAGGDCNDFDAAVKPGAVEQCDSRDNDCDGETDEPGSGGCMERYKDADRDGFGVAGVTECRCAAQVPWDATKVGDCNDDDVAVFPGATEACNTKDDNCDGVTDVEGSQGCTVFTMDRDGDGWGLANNTKCLCIADGLYRVRTSGDCEDNNSKIYPGAIESCNGKDDDCDGVTDEEGAANCKVFYRDDDRDGFGRENDSRCLCASVDRYTTRIAMDCCDQDDKVHPGQIGFYSVKSKCSTWDYDCSGGTDAEIQESGGGCSGWGVGSGCDLRTGWSGTIPPCGETRLFVNSGCGHCCAFWTCCCDAEGVNRTQRCR